MERTCQHVNLVTNTRTNGAHGGTHSIQPQTTTGDGFFILRFCTLTVERTHTLEGQGGKNDEFTLTPTCVCILRVCVCVYLCM